MLSYIARTLGSIPTQNMDVRPFILSLRFLMSEQASRSLDKYLKVQKTRKIEALADTGVSYTYRKWSTVQKYKIGPVISFDS